MFFRYYLSLLYFRGGCATGSCTTIMADTPPKPNMALRYAGLATQWMVMLLLAVYVGYKVDRLTNLPLPLFLILFPLISLTFSLWQLIKQLNKPR